jgi:myo-inositol-1(or 4)-monophosphatase
MDKNKALRVAIKAAKEAGKALTEELEKKHAEEKDNLYFQKGYRQIRSDIDLKADSLIKVIIGKNFPSHNILTEESSSTGKASKYTWVIDPLCGTIAYLRTIPNFVVGISLLENKKIILGVINAPARGEVFYATRDKGSFLNDSPIKVSSLENLGDSVVEVQHAVLRNKNHQPSFLKIAEAVRRFRMSDSMNLGMAYVACGRTDAILNLIQPLYDFAAGMLIVEEAGGKVTNFKGGKVEFELDTVRRNNILASNGKVHGKLIEILK